MALNPSKSGAILFGTSQRLKAMSGLTSVKIADSVIQFSDCIKILGATLDANLNMGPYTKATSKSCFCHIRSFRQIRSSMDRSLAVSVASALVSSRFDYANSVLFGCPQKHTARLQRAQHALARVVTQQRSGSSSTASTELLKQLHWLPIEWRIRFKLATLTFKELHTGHPPYLADLLQYHKTTKSTRSSASRLLSVPRHNLSFGSRAFRISAPKIWNSLPPHILQSQTLDSFRHHLKTYYFQSAYPGP